jgi:hypothetical protein
MKKSDMRTKLYKTLQRLGISNPADWQDYIDILLIKLEFLNDLQRYDRLLKNIFSSNDKSGFNSYAFEAAFAYDFEVKGHKLEYEVKSLSDSLTSIDYCYETEGRKIYFELRVINQRDALTTDIENQLKHNGFYQISQGGEEETIRIQQSILDKCHDNKKDEPVKFGHEDGSYNFIVVFVSALHLGMIDKADCLLAMYGDEGVHPIYRLGVFGLCQQLSAQATEEERKYYGNFDHFRKTIHGVLFVKNASRGGDPNYFVDLQLQYFLVGNNNILEKEEGGAIIENLSSFLLTWSDNYEFDAILSNTEFFDTFTQSLENIKTLLNTKVDADVEQLFLQLLYVNIITTLETYLSDAFINTLFNNEKIMRKFVETTKEFMEEKMCFSDIFSKMDGVEKKVRGYLLDLVWHNLSKVGAIYKSTLDISFTDITDKQEIFKAIDKRQDFVHRGGKTKDGKQHKLGLNDIEDLINNVQAFVKCIDDKLKDAPIT